MLCLALFSFFFSLRLQLPATARTRRKRRGKFLTKMQKVVGMFGLQLLAPRMKNIFQNVAVFLDNFVFVFTDRCSSCMANPRHLNIGGCLEFTNLSAIVTRHTSQNMDTTIWP